MSYGRSIFGGRVGGNGGVAKVSIDPTYQGRNIFAGLGQARLPPPTQRRAAPVRPPQGPGVPFRVLLPPIVSLPSPGAVCPPGTARLGAACVAPLTRCPPGTISRGHACISLPPQATARGLRGYGYVPPEYNTAAMRGMGYVPPGYPGVGYVPPGYSVRGVGYVPPGYPQFRGFGSSPDGLVGFG
jgi:hypothetical protein